MIERSCNLQFLKFFKMFKLFRTQNNMFITVVCLYPIIHIKVIKICLVIWIQSYAYKQEIYLCENT